MWTNTYKSKGKKISCRTVNSKSIMYYLFGRSRVNIQLIGIDISNMQRSKEKQS